MDAADPPENPALLPALAAAAAALLRHQAAAYGLLGLDVAGRGLASRLHAAAAAVGRPGAAAVAGRPAARGAGAVGAASAAVVPARAVAVAGAGAGGAGSAAAASANAPGLSAAVPVVSAAAPAVSAAAPAAAAAAVAGAGDSVPDLDAVRLALGDCQRCKLARTRTTLVFGVGHPRARLMLVGEGPGRDEDLQGEPFVGPAGQLLDRMLAAMGLSRSAVYIANVVKCRPPRNRDPEPDEVAACAPFLRQQVASVRPEVLVSLGRYASQCLLGEPTAIGRLRGKWRRYADIPLMPTFHPAYLLRSPGDKRLAWQDLQAVMARLAGVDARGAKGAVGGL